MPSISSQSPIDVRDKLRHEPFRPKLPAGAPHDRSRRALRHRQHVRNRVRRNHLGHPRLQALQPDQLLSRPGRPHVRHGLQLAARRICTIAACSTNTMVVATGEFGRTPKVNPAGGRDHWPQCWTMMMAGGGVKGGQVIGASDEIGGAPQDTSDAPRRRSPPPSITAWAFRLGTGTARRARPSDSAGRSRHRTASKSCSYRWPPP